MPRQQQTPRPVQPAPVPQQNPIQPAPASRPVAQVPSPAAVENDPFAPNPPDPAAPIPVPQTVTREAIAGMGGAAATGGAIGAAASIAANMANARANQAPAQPLAQLIDVVTRETLEVNAARCIIGRERAAADVILRDPNVSRRHAELTFTGSDWSIEDLNSTNGTFVNNRRITRCPLRNGDLLTFGLSNFEFRS